MTSQDAKVEVFHRLHADGCFVMPNPWDVGTAVALEGMGFKLSRRRARATRGLWVAPTTGSCATRRWSIFARSPLLSACR
jgi:2-methylisocitrate lyase-like PEP mutase family enzyme